MQRGVAVLALAILASLGSCTPVRKAQADCVPTTDTKCRPRLSGALLDGAQIEATSFKDKVVLVNFWATWCTPCIVEMPAFQKVYERHAGDGFVIVGVLFSDAATDDEVRAFLSDR